MLNQSISTGEGFLLPHTGENLSQWLIATQFVTVFISLDV